MSVLFLEYPKCTTCQRAKRRLTDLHLKGRLPEMNEEEQYELLATDGMLVKRPVIVREDFVPTGFREKEWEEKLQQQKLFEK